MTVDWGCKNCPVAADLLLREADEFQHLLSEPKAVLVQEIIVLRDMLKELRTSKNAEPCFRCSELEEELQDARDRFRRLIEGDAVEWE